MSLERYKEFLKRYGWADKACTFLAGDCSERKYYRLGSDVTGFVLLMDAPPPGEKLEDFVEVGSLLLDLGLSVPEIIACDLEKGLALIEDFGDFTYSRSFLRGGSHKELYGLAVEALIYLHKKFEKFKNDIPLTPYSMELYTRELALCLEWYYPMFYERPLPEQALKKWQDMWSNLLKPLVKEETLVLRDFMVDNLIYLKKRQGVQRCGLLDFQDAVIGPRAYDLVSLLEDARYDVPQDIQQKMIEKYLTAFPQLNREAFLQDYYILGAQRSTKILGVFARMFKRYNKSKYLEHLPRVWKWLEQDLRHPALKPMREWFEQYMPENERKVLDAN